MMIDVSLTVIGLDELEHLSLHNTVCALDFKRRNRPHKRDLLSGWPRTEPFCKSPESLKHVNLHDFVNLGLFRSDRCCLATQGLEETCRNLGPVQTSYF